MTTTTSVKELEALLAEFERRVRTLGTHERLTALDVFAKYFARLGDGAALFTRIKNEAMRRERLRSNGMKDFMRKRKQGKQTLHHVFTSLGSLKSSDFLVVNADADAHNEFQDSPEWLLAQVPLAIGNLMDYCRHLELSIEAKEAQLSLPLVPVDSSAAK